MALYVVNPASIDDEAYHQWNLTGNDIGQFYRKPEYADHVQQLLSELPTISLPYPFRIGFTGYVEMTQPISEHSYGQCCDQIGRNVFIVDKYFLFQRFPKGDLYMYTTTWTTDQSTRDPFYQEVTSDVWDNIMKTLNKRQ